MVPHIFMIIFYLYLINRMLRRSILIRRVMFFKHNFTKGLVSEMLDASGTLRTSEKTLVQAGLSWLAQKVWCTGTCANSMGAFLWAFNHNPLYFPQLCLHTGTSHHDPSKCILSNALTSGWLLWGWSGWENMVSISFSSKKLNMTTNICIHTRLA